MGQIKQNAAGKAEFKSKVLDIFKANPNVQLTRAELCAMTGYTDSNLRREIAEVAHFYPVISLSRGKGYVFLTWEGTQSVEELKNARDIIVEQLAETSGRIDALKKRLKPLIANLRVLDKIINDKQ